MSSFSSSNKLDFLRLTLVTNKGYSDAQSYLNFVSQCIKGGITCVQLREKAMSPEELLYFGEQLKSFLDSQNIPLIVNDDPYLCNALDAFGLHLGQSDATVQKARSIIGENKTIGLSVNTIAQLESANSQDIDYIGIGSIFPTKSKPNVDNIWGLDSLKQAALLSKHPIIAIGGIDEHNAESVIKAGAAGIAAISAFHDAKDPFKATRNLLNSLKAHLDTK